MDYPSDVKDKEWEKIKAFFDRPDPRGKCAKYDVHLVVNAIFYITKTGCHWRYLPLDFPPWGATSALSGGTSAGCGSESWMR